jgi:hypothetical protein
MQHWMINLLLNGEFGIKFERLCTALICSIISMFASRDWDELEKIHAVVLTDILILRFWNTRQYRPSPCDS